MYTHLFQLTSTCGNTYQYQSHSKWLMVILHFKETHLRYFYLTQINTNYKKNLQVYKIGQRSKSNHRE